MGCPTMGGKRSSAFGLIAIINEPMEPVTLEAPKLKDYKHAKDANILCYVNEV
jgi:hypothetical protein